MLSLVDDSIMNPGNRCAETEKTCSLELLKKAKEELRKPVTIVHPTLAFYLNESWYTEEEFIFLMAYSGC